MDVDSTNMATEPESNQAPTTEHSSSGESSSAPPPYGLTPRAMEALREDGSQVLVCSESSLLLFHGSKALQGNLPVPLPAHPDDIFADFLPYRHSLIVQNGQRTILYRRPDQQTENFYKEAIAAWVARSRRQGVNRKRHMKLRDKPGDSGKQPDGRLPSAIDSLVGKDNSCLIVIKKVAANIELQSSTGRKIEKIYTLGVIFPEWKLSTAALPVLPLLPSPSSNLPCFYIANPATREGNHLFGDMATKQNFLVANSDIESSPHYLYSRDGWLLFQMREGDSNFDKRFPKYPVFLLNLATGVRMDLPSPSFWFVDGVAAFCTTSQGTPEVVTYALIHLYTVKVYMARPGGECWEDHSYKFSIGSDAFMQKSFLCGNSLYLFFRSHSLVFKLTDLSWHLLTHGNHYPKFLECTALELEGKVVMVDNPEYFSVDRLAHDPICFFRMEISGDNVEWVEITSRGEELDGRIWFIDSLRSFSIKVAGSGQKMCWFARNPWNKQGHIYGTVCKMHCLNLTTRAHYRLIADSVFCSQRAWVDLGCLSDHALLDCGITGDDLLPGL